MSTEDMVIGPPFVVVDIKVTRTRCSLANLALIALASTGVLATAKGF